MMIKSPMQLLVAPKQYIYFEKDDTQPLQKNDMQPLKNIQCRNGCEPILNSIRSTISIQ